MVLCMRLLDSRFRQSACSVLVEWMCITPFLWCASTRSLWALGALVRHPAFGYPLTPPVSFHYLLCRYELTVGHLEPSYVIQRFLDVQRLHALTRYLERLHAQVRC